MKKLYFLILVLAAGCGGEKTANSGANNGNAVKTNSVNSTVNAKTPETASPDATRFFSDKTMKAEDRAAAIQKYVNEIEARLPKNNQTASSLQRKEIILSADSLKGVTDEKWAKLHSYSDGTAVKRLKVYAPEGSEKSEEFYYYEGKPVFVFIEPKGKNSEPDDSGVAGDKFYFGEEGLIGWTKTDGTKVDAGNEEFKKYGEKLKKEADAFINAK